jgi:hypothetical protein
MKTLAIEVLGWLVLQIAIVVTTGFVFWADWQWWVLTIGAIIARQIVNAAQDIE